MAFRVALDERAPEHADDVAAFEQREIERDLRDLAGRKADHQKAPLPGDRAQRGFGVRPADRIVDHVGALAAGDAAQRLLQVFLRVVDRRRRRRARLQNASLSSDDAQAITRAPISLPISIAASPVPPEAPSTASVSPALSLRAVLQRMQRGAVDHRDAGGAVEVERVGDLHHALRGDRDLLARRAEAAIAEHAVARRQARHARADALHHAGEFGGGRERKRRLELVFAGDDQRVEEIERRGLRSRRPLRRGRARGRAGRRIRDRRGRRSGCRGWLSWRALHSRNWARTLGRPEQRAVTSARKRAARAGRGAFTLPISPVISMTSGALGEAGGPMTTNSRVSIDSARAGGGGRPVDGRRRRSRARPPSRPSPPRSPRPKSETKSAAAEAGASKPRRAPRPGGAQPSLLGQFGDWGAYTATNGGKKVCYALAKPVLAGDRAGRTGRAIRPTSSSRRGRPRTCATRSRS